MLSAVSEASTRSRDVSSTTGDVVNTLDNVLQKLSSLKRKVCEKLLYSNYLKQEKLRQKSV